MNKLKYIVPNAFTSLSFMMGVSAVLMAPLAVICPGAHLGKDCLQWASWLVVYSVLFDKLDGFAAKKLGASTEFGAQLDSLADLISFGIAPAMIVFFTLYTKAHDFLLSNLPLVILSLTLYVLCSAYRLARYNAGQAELKEYFIGMPTTLAGGVLSVLVLLMSKSDNWFGIGFNPWVVTLVELVLGPLMVSSLYLSKLRARRNAFFNYFQIACVLAGYAFGIAQLFPEVLLAEVGIYAVLGFLWGLVFRRRITAQYIHREA